MYIQYIYIYIYICIYVYNIYTYSLLADLYLKEMDSHQYLHTSSCHPYHCLKSVLYSQALRLNGICLNSTFYDNRFNQLER